MELHSVFLLLLVSALVMSTGCHVLSTRVANEGTNFFVAVDGNDANPGSREKPFATLERARDEIRKSKAADKPIVVYLRGGDYLRTNTLDLVAGDSGTAAAPVVWQAYKGESVRLLGGRALTGFQPVTEPAVLARFDEGARKHVVELDLRSLGITSYGELTSRGRAFDRPVAVAHPELFFDHRPMTLARWPNEGEFAKIAGYPATTDPKAEFGGLSVGFYYSGDRPQRWQDAGDLWIHGYWAFDWANSYEKVASLDLGQRLIKTAPPYGIYGFRKDQRFYFLNLLEELDQPGEWFLDRKTGILYFWPPDAGSAPELLLSLLDQPLLKLTDVSNVTFRGLTLEATRANAVEIRGGANDRLVACTIRNIGNAAVIIEGGTGHGVAGCDIFDTGDGGVVMEGGDRQTLTPGGHFVENCHFQRQGRWSKCYVPAIRMAGVGLRASHNLIHDLPHCAVIFLGNDHLIEFNDIHHVALETGDVGAIYSGDDYSFRGNRIRHNFIHHTGGVGLGSMGVYMDDWVSGTEVFGNVFYKVHWAVFLGGGRDHQVANNLFVDCDPAVQMDARGLDPTPQWRAGADVRLRASLAAVPLPLYRARYPEMKTLDAYYGPPGGPAITGEAFKGIPPENNSLVRNVCVGKWLGTHWHATPAMLRQENNLTDASSSLAEQPNDQSPATDFELKQNSPAWALGFLRIPVEQIGLLKDDLRRSLSFGKVPSVPATTMNPQ
jgi:hypothetical protein